MERFLIVITTLVIGVGTAIAVFRYGEKHRAWRLSHPVKWLLICVMMLVTGTVACSVIAGAIITAFDQIPGVPDRVDLHNQLSEAGVYYVALSPTIDGLGGITPLGGLATLQLALEEALRAQYPDGYFVIEDERTTGKYPVGQTKVWRLAVYEPDGEGFKLVATAPLLDPVEAVKGLTPTIRVEDAGDPNSPQS